MNGLVVFLIIFFVLLLIAGGIILTIYLVDRNRKTKQTGSSAPTNNGGDNNQNSGNNQNGGNNNRTPNTCNVPNITSATRVFQQENTDGSIEININQFALDTVTNQQQPNTNLTLTFEVGLNNFETIFRSNPIPWNNSEISNQTTPVSCSQTACNIFLTGNLFSPPITSLGDYELRILIEPDPRQNCTPLITRSMTVSGQT